MPAYKGDPSCFFRSGKRAGSQFELSIKDNQASLEKIKASNRAQVYDLTATEKEAWRKALQPLSKEMESRIGKDVIDVADKEAAAAGFAQ